MSTTKAKTKTTNWLPSNKWWSATVIGAAGVATAWANAGHWSATLTVAAIGYGAQRLVAYFTPNGATPDQGAAA